MKDQNNNPITDISELSCECGEGNLCPLHGRPYGMSEEKTVEELFDEYAGVMYVGYMETLENQEKRKKQIIQEVKQQVRREVVEEIKLILELSGNGKGNNLIDIEQGKVPAYYKSTIDKILEGITLKN